MADQVVADKLKLSDAPKKLKSKVWQYFEFRDGSPTDKAKCKLCFTDVAYAKSGSTTNLMQQVKRKYNVDLARLRVQQLKSRARKVVLFLLEFC
ncbi:hypothetical protein DPMN_047286 [Dreissena polymorpha]|uniref:BED-type domain-containing protein n=1 Tax=Dreissena polymorpha TaxID=45954 RepID=A0A9D4D8H5_DREPO|nr:hypothetical protein DPMN_047286 [Dreissena polymorpha]